jgi:hypothetical protein
MISARPLRAFSAAALMAAACLASCDSEGTAPPDGDAMHITLADPDLTLVAGTAGIVRVTVVRNAFDGLITLRTEGVPSGVTVPDVVVAENETEAEMVFTATAGAAPGISDVSIRAETGIDSVPPSIRHLHLQIRPPGSFSLMCDPIAVIAGGTASTTFTVNRVGGFTGTVTLALSAPPGIVAALQPAELSGNTSTSLVTIAADRTLRPGAYSVRVTASSPGFADETFDITVTVAASSPSDQTVRPPAS